MSNRRIYNVLMLLWVAVAVASCGGEPPVIDTSGEQRPDLRKNSTTANRYLVEREETTIASYIERRGWTVETLACGARVHEYERGRGAMIGNDDTVTMRYTVEKLNGARLYSDTTVTFVAGRLEPCEGLDAAVRTLHRGSKAHVVLPSSVGYGVVGDGANIPPRTPLSYSLEIL